GHDAQSMKGIAPLGMIFVPSRDGVSHAPSEYTSPAEITNGANVLLLTILGMDRLLQ
ncbi:MAG: M20/M25/M40 family metallo-hydrolase, partial [Gammaproteobacteria bacterium]|nr:M20/M25/M40 family metallo-hydrolase [Gammaproteobacteria bacterium]